MQPATLSTLRELFNDRLQENVSLAGYTAARIGGLADAIIFVHSENELITTAIKLWDMKLPFVILGGGTNVLASDKGLRGVVLVNRARLVRFDMVSEPPNFWAESGSTLNTIAQRAARLGLSRMEWAASVPGSLGGAIYGNAGAFDGNIAGNLASVEILHRERGVEIWPMEKMGYSYRSSVLKREPQPVLILAATLELGRGKPNEIHATMEQLSTLRHGSQPSGASMGSMFKNPPGDFAGRLIEAAGLKGKRIGNAEISPFHANFCINHGKATAKDVKELIDLARNTVEAKFGIRLELEIELIGEWN
jgi:UDP-N-acetylmuramate dehydrogenase